MVHHASPRERFQIETDTGYAVTSDKRAVFCQALLDLRIAALRDFDGRLVEEVLHRVTDPELLIAVPEQ